MVRVRVSPPEELTISAADISRVADSEQEGKEVSSLAKQVLKMAGCYASFQAIELPTTEAHGRNPLYYIEGS